MSNMEATLQQLVSLPTDENPFEFLHDLLRDEISRDWSKVHTVLLAVCSLVWAGSLVANVIVMSRKLRKGETALIRRQGSCLGVFWVPQISLIWPMMAVLLSLCFLCSVALLIYQAYHRPLVLSYIVILLLYPFVTCLTWIQVNNVVVAALIAYASRIHQDATRRFNIALLTNISAVSYPLISCSSQVVLVWLQNVPLGHVLNACNEIDTTLVQLAAQWTPIDGKAAFIQLKALEPAFQTLQAHSSSYAAYNIALTCVVFVHCCVQLCVFVPAVSYQIRDLRRQLRDIGAAQRNLQLRNRSTTSLNSAKRHAIHRFLGTLMVRYSQTQIVSRASLSTAGQESSGERLALLEAVCKNILVTTIWFTCGVLCFMPLAGYAVYVVVGGEAAGSKAVNVQVASMVLFTVLFCPIDAVLYLRARLATNLAAPSLPSFTASTSEVDENHSVITLPSMLLFRALDSDSDERFQKQEEKHHFPS